MAEQTNLPSIPPPNENNLVAFARAVKEALEVRLGRRGQGLDAMVTFRDLDKVQMVQGDGRGGVVGLRPPAAIGTVGGGYDPTLDTTPPSAPQNVKASGAVRNIILEWDGPPSTYRNHAYAEVWRSSTNNLNDAAQIGQSGSTMYVDNVGEGQARYYWVRFVSQANVTGPWHAAGDAGVQAATAIDVGYTLGLLEGQIGEDALATETINGKDAFVFDTKTFAIRFNETGYTPFVVQSTPTTINGVEIPAGVYLDAAFMRTFVAQAGQIGALAVDDAAIANLSAAKLTAGDGTIGGILKSANYVSGVSGWAVHPSGWAEFANATVRGTIYADTGWFKGQIIGGAATTYTSGAGMWTGVDAGTWKFRLGSSGTYLRWDGASLTLRGTLTIEDGSGNVLLSSGTGIPWDRIGGSGKPENGATVGAPAGTLVAGVPAANVATAVTDFNASNNRNSAAITTPSIATGGTAVDHVAQKDGSVDISFEWAWGGNEGDIDGFLVFARQSASETAYTFGTNAAEETVYTVPASKRAFVLFGVAADQYYTFGVQAYRAVDKAVNAAGVIKSALVKATGSGENPYRPRTSVAFTGDVTGTVGGTAAATLVSTASTALTNANNARTEADKANASLADIAADNKLTPAEKKSVRKEWDAIYAERAGIRAQADSFGITTEKTNYDNDFQALGTYLNGGTAYTIGATPPSWITDANLAVTTTIVGTTFRANWANLYADRQALLNKISAEAAKKADWANVTNKTGFASISQITSSNVTTYIANAAIGNAQIGNIIQSNNYVPNSSGWYINKSGFCEFQNGLFRGTIKGSIIDGATIISTNQLQPTDAGAPYYTSLFNQVATRTADFVKSGYAGREHRATTAAIGFYAYNQGPANTSTYARYKNYTITLTLDVSHSSPVVGNETEYLIVQLVRKDTGAAIRTLVERRISTGVNTVVSGLTVQYGLWVALRITGSFTHNHDQAYDLGLYVYYNTGQSSGYDSGSGSASITGKTL